MAIVTINNKNFDSITSADGIVMVDCWAEWCTACQSFNPIYEKVAQKYSRHTFAKLDTVAEKELIEPGNLGRFQTWINVLLGKKRSLQGPECGGPKRRIRVWRPHHPDFGVELAAIFDIARSLEKIGAGPDRQTQIFQRFHLRVKIGIRKGNPAIFRFLKNEKRKNTDRFNR